MNATALKTSDFFTGIVQTEHKDYDVKLPIFYYDNSALSAIYTASTAQVRKRLPFPNMHPVELIPGRCLLALSAFEYRRTDIGPYNEFSVAAIISYGKRAIPGLTSLSCMMRNEFAAYILYLPVTSERARRGGLEMAGYPKFLADIVFTRDPQATTCTVSEDGRRILTLRGKNTETSRGRLTKYKLYTSKGGIPLGANLYMNPLQYAQMSGRNMAALELGTGHRISTDLRDLALGRRPLLYQYIPSYEAILFGSKNIIDD